MGNIIAVVSPRFRDTNNSKAKERIAYSTSSQGRRSFLPSDPPQDWWIWYGAAIRVAIYIVREMQTSMTGAFSSCLIWCWYLSSLAAVIRSSVYWIRALKPYQSHSPRDVCVPFPGCLVMKRKGTNTQNSYPTKRFYILSQQQTNTHFTRHPARKVAQYGTFFMHSIPLIQSKKGRIGRELVLWRWRWR